MCRFQLERLGYFCVDTESTPGAMVLNRTCTLKVGCWALAVLCPKTVAAAAAAAGTLLGMCQGGCRHGVSTHAVCSQWAVQLWWLGHPRHASRPSVCKPAHGVLHFGMLLCIAAVQAIHANNWVAARASGFYALITAPLAPWPPFFAPQESFPKQTAAKGGRK